MPDIEEAVRRFVAEVWNGGREESAYDLVAADCPGRDAPGPEGAIAWHRERRSAFPDLRYRIVDLVVDGERAALRWRAVGTQAGPLGPLPPSGKMVTYSGATFMRFDGEGRIADVWSVNELLDLLQQLGVQLTQPSAAGTAESAG
jgi:steroid delta-isomerase-like uncharacterized protein